MMCKFFFLIGILLMNALSHAAQESLKRVHEKGDMVVSAKKRARTFDENLTPQLWDALRSKNALAVQKLLKQNANPNARASKMSVLHYAAARGYVGIVQLLLATEGVNKNIVVGETETGEPVGYEVGYQDYIEGSTGLSLAASCGGDICEEGDREDSHLYEAIVQNFIDHNADLEKGNPLIAACMWGTLGMVRNLIAAGASASSEALKAAALRPCPAMTRELIEAGANVNGRVSHEFFNEDFKPGGGREATIFSILIDSYLKDDSSREEILQIIERFLEQDVDTEIDLYKKCRHDKTDRITHTKVPFSHFFKCHPPLIKAFENAYNRRYRLQTSQILQGSEFPIALQDLVNIYTPCMRVLTSSDGSWKIQ